MPVGVYIGLEPGEMFDIFTGLHMFFWRIELENVFFDFGFCFAAFTGIDILFGHTGVCFKTPKPRTNIPVLVFGGGPIFHRLCI